MPCSHCPRSLRRKPMKTLYRSPGKWASHTLVALSSIVLAGFAGGGTSNDKALQLTVPRAVCGPNDHPETALQGQVPANLRANGFHGFNCNLELVGQSRGDGANLQIPQFNPRSSDAYPYHRTPVTTAYRTNFGVPVINATNP